MSEFDTVITGRTIGTAADDLYSRRGTAPAEPNLSRQDDQIADVLRLRRRDWPVAEISLYKGLSARHLVP